jgi:thiol-disulfide isomerase/thioredoxin
MIDRLIILFAVVAAIGAVWGLVQLWRRFMVNRMQQATPFASIVPANMPAVVAFSTPTCSECRTRQAPALQQLEHELGGRVAIVRVSALEYAELAEQAGILTVPATVVLDQRGIVRHLNLGFADSIRLKAQLLGHA